LMNTVNAAAAAEESMLASHHLLTHGGSVPLLKTGNCVLWRVS
jgi:hypothetical protein